MQKRRLLSQGRFLDGLIFVLLKEVRMNNTHYCSLRQILDVIKRFLVIIRIIIEIIKELL